MEHLQLAQQRKNNHAAPSAACPAGSETQTFFSVKQFAQVERGWTEPALRNHIHNAQPRKSANGDIPGNGLLECGAIVRLGRKVLIHRERWLQWAQRKSCEKHSGYAK